MLFLRPGEGAMALRPGPYMPPLAQVERGGKSADGAISISQRKLLP